MKLFVAFTALATGLIIVFANGMFIDLSTKMQDQQLLPTISRRQLAENPTIVTEQQARAACKHWKSNRETCVYDVLKTNDLELAKWEGPEYGE